MWFTGPGVVVPIAPLALSCTTAVPGAPTAICSPNPDISTEYPYPLNSGYNVCRVPTQSKGTSFTIALSVPTFEYVCVHVDVNIECSYTYIVFTFGAPTTNLSALSPAIDTENPNEVTPLPLSPFMV